MKTNSIEILKGTKASIKRQGDACSKSFTFREDTVFAPEEWSCSNGIVTTTRTVNGVQWIVRVLAGKVQTVAHQCAVNWDAASASHDRTHGQGQGHNLHRVMENRATRRVVIDLNRQRKTREDARKAIALEVESVTMDSCNVADLDGLYRDLGVTRVAHLDKAGPLTMVQSWLVNGSSQDAYTVNLASVASGAVIRVDCACKGGFWYRKDCTHGRRAVRAHRRTLNAVALLEEGVEALDVVEICTGGRRAVPSPAGPLDMDHSLPAFSLSDQGARAASVI